MGFYSGECHQTNYFNHVQRHGFGNRPTQWGPAIGPCKLSGRRGRECVVFPLYRLTDEPGFVLGVQNYDHRYTPVFYLLRMCISIHDTFI